MATKTISAIEPSLEQLNPSLTFEPHFIKIETSSHIPMDNTVALPSFPSSAKLSKSFESTNPPKISHISLLGNPKLSNFQTSLAYAFPL